MTPVIPAKLLFVSLLALVVIVIIGANSFSQDAAVISSSVLNLIITASLVAVSAILLARNGIRGDLGMAMVFFVSFVVLWFVAERIWMAYDLIYHADPWPSEADYFWLAGYPLYFVFTVFYLKPFRNSITKKTIALSLGITGAMVGFLIYYTMPQNSGLSITEVILGFSYPVFDTICLAPVIVGLILFFRGQVSFLWTCLLFGMICFAASDYGFLFLSLDSTYYTGHPVDIPYLWAYLFFLAGAYSHIRIFRKRNLENQFDRQGELR